MPAQSQTELECLNPAIERMVEVVGSQSKVAVLLNEYAEEMGIVRTVYQSHVWRAMYQHGQFAEKLVGPAMRICAEYGLDDITIYDLRPSTPRF